MNKLLAMKIVVCPVVDCPACGKLMRLAYVVPAFAAHAEIRSFKCDSCGEVRTTEIEAAVSSGRLPLSSGLFPLTT
jgi:hypothetical protein